MYGLLCFERLKLITCWINQLINEAWDVGKQTDLTNAVKSDDDGNDDNEDNLNKISIVGKAIKNGLAVELCIRIGLKFCTLQSTE